MGGERRVGEGGMSGGERKKGDGGAEVDTERCGEWERGSVTEKGRVAKPRSCWDSARRGCGGRAGGGEGRIYSCDLLASKANKRPFPRRARVS